MKRHAAGFVLRKNSLRLGAVRRDTSLKEGGKRAPSLRELSAAKPLTEGVIFLRGT